MQPLSLLDTAEYLLKPKHGAISQANLRRSRSTIYYAVFHCLARDCADMLIGGKNSDRSEKAWVQVYRALNHGKTWTRCEKVVTLNFPDSIKDFALTFRDLLIKRERADYDPTAKFTRGEVVADIDGARQVIADYKAEEKKHRRAFAAYVLLEKQTEKKP